MPPPQAGPPPGASQGGQPKGDLMSIIMPLLLILAGAGIEPVLKNLSGILGKAKGGKPQAGQPGQPKPAPPMAGGAPPIPEG